MTPEVNVRHGSTFADDEARLIAQLRERMNELRTAELQKCLRKLGPIPTELHDALEQFTAQMTNEILYQPIVEVKRSPSEV